ncbi:MAG: hypothetical protein MZU95_15755 [Desulfomicrobium escambiense]|nr:hypothetical protein [Desulfomicrobium escambiense]
MSFPAATAIIAGYGIGGGMLAPALPGLPQRDRPLGPGPGGSLCSVPPSAPHDRGAGRRGRQAAARSWNPSGSTCSRERAGRPSPGSSSG